MAVKAASGAENDWNVIRAGLSRHRTPARLAHRQQDEQDGERPGYRRDQEDRAVGTRSQREHGPRDERPDRGADGVERPMHAEAAAALRFAAALGDESVARRRADALAETVREPQHEHRGPARRDGQDGLGQVRDGVADRDQRLAPPDVVGQPPRAHLHERGGGLRERLDQADRRDRRSQHVRQVERQHRIDHLGRRIREQAHDAHHPDVPGCLHHACSTSGLLVLEGVEGQP